MFNMMKAALRNVKLEQARKIIASLEIGRCKIKVQE
jgi:hypothetical protein